MNISPISAYKNYNNYSSKRANQASFKGCLSDSAVNQALNMLKPKVTATKACQSLEALKAVMDNLAKKWQKSSIGLMIVPEDTTAKFLGKEAANFDIRNNNALCVAVSDTFGPIEKWKSCLEAITVLIPKSLLK